jgi:hypothetical protein
MNLKWMRIPVAAYNGFFRIAGGCRSGRNHLFVLLFRDIELVEAVVRYRSDAVVFRDNDSLTRSITMEDYRIGPVADDCFDLFYIAEKQHK